MSYYQQYMGTTNQALQLTAPLQVAPSTQPTVQYTVARYPPIQPTKVSESSTTYVGTISGQAYGNGTYTYQTSNTYAWVSTGNNRLSSLPNTSPNLSFCWQPSSAVNISSCNDYSASAPYAYFGPGSATYSPAVSTYSVSTNTTYYGLYLMIQTPYPITLTSCVVASVNPTSSIGTAIVLGSIDGTNWSYLTAITNSLTWVQNIPQTINLSTSGSWNYFRFVITGISGNYQGPLLTQFYIQGYEQSTTNSIVVVNQPTSNNPTIQINGPSGSNTNGLAFCNGGNGGWNSATYRSWITLTGGLNASPANALQFFNDSPNLKLTDNVFTFYSYINGRGALTTNLTMLANGNVGIGIINPDSALQITGNTSLGKTGNGTSLYGWLLAAQGTTSNTGYIEFRTSTASRRGYIGWGDSSFLYISGDSNSTGADVGICISPSGYTTTSGSIGNSAFFTTNGVGIGTAAPRNMLDITIPTGQNSLGIIIGNGTYNTIIRQHTISNTDGGLVFYNNSPLIINNSTITPATPPQAFAFYTGSSNITVSFYSNWASQNGSGGDLITSSIYFGSNPSYSCCMRSVVPNSLFADCQRIDLCTTTASNTPSVTPRLTIMSQNGFVGIGTTNPSYPLHINIRNNTNDSTAVSYFSRTNPGGTVWGTDGLVSTNGIGIFTPYSIWTQAYYFVSSDQRIKTNINQADTNDVLNKIISLPLMTYNYVDYVADGVQTVYGMIAQTVQTVFPEAITLTTTIIPSIYRLADSILLSEDGLNVVIQVAISDSSELKVGGFVELIVDGISNKIQTKVIQFTSSQLIVSVWEKFDATKEVFVYGAQIDDFHTLDKNYLGIICMGGIQELSKRNDSLTTQVTTLQTNNDLLTNNLIAQQQTITQMQEQITTLMQQMASLLQK